MNDEKQPSERSASFLATTSSESPVDDDASSRRFHAVGENTTNFAGAGTSTVLHSIREDDEIEAEIRAKGLTAPRVTPERIESVIAAEYFFTAADGVCGAKLSRDYGQPAPIDNPAGTPSLNLLTFCVLVLRNGFTVTGESACASPQNFNAELGRKIARKHAVDKIWQLEGYLLRDQLHSQPKPTLQGDSRG